MEEIDATADEFRKTDVKSPCVNFRVWELMVLSVGMRVYMIFSK